jgi:hypothetical protein
MFLKLPVYDDDDDDKIRPGHWRGAPWGLLLGARPYQPPDQVRGPSHETDSSISVESAVVTLPALMAVLQLA